MPKDARPEFIESTAGEVAAELVRRGIRADQRITVTIEPDEPDDWIEGARLCPSEGDSGGLERYRHRPHHQGRAQSRTASQRMRLVVDTNIFVSAALKESSWPGQTIQLIGRYGGLLKRGLSQTSGIDGSSGMAVDFTLRRRGGPP